MRPNLTSIAEELDRDLRAIRTALRRPLEAEIARGALTGPQMSAMQVLLTSGGLSLKELSKQLGLAHSTVSGIVDRLENRGMVERRQEEADKRFSRIVPTAQVRAWLRDTWPKLETNPLAEALARATPAQRKQVVEGMRTLRELLQSTK